MTPSLQEAINLARAGQKDNARALFMQIIQQNPRDETAWLWLSDCLPDDPQRIQAFETCLRFNPESHRARMALDLLRNKASSEGLEDSAREAPFASRETPADTGPTTIYREDPLPQVGDFEIKGNISDDFLFELEEETEPVEKTKPNPKPVLNKTPQTQTELRQDSAAVEPTKMELSSEDQLVQSLRKPKRWNFHLPSFLSSRPRDENPAKGRFRRTLIVVASLVIMLVAFVAVMMGHPNFQVSNLSAILARFNLPGVAKVNPPQNAVDTASTPTLTIAETASPTAEASPTPSLSQASALPAGQPGENITLKVDSTASLPKPLSQHTASLLPDGHILLTGGFLHGGGYGYSYLYDPTTGAFTQSGSLLTGRYGHNAVVLSDGRVLVTGGKNLDGDVYTSEAFDPQSGAWKRMVMAFDHGTGHTSTLLSNGQVLVAGGCTPAGPTYAAELYDPASNSWKKIPPMPGDRCNATATLLADGRVLVVGETPDVTETSAVIFDPASQAWTRAADLQTPRSSHAATLLPDGRVLVTGGQNSRSGALNSAEVYDPAKDAWSELGAMSQARFGHAAVLLPDARLVVIGGFDRKGGAPLDTLEVYYPGSNAWSAPAKLETGLVNFSAVLLPEGKIWVAGGTTDGQSNTGAAETVMVMK